MAVGGQEIGAVNDFIARDPHGALAVCEELLAAGAVTLTAIGTALGISRHFNRTQLLEVDLLDEDIERTNPVFWTRSVASVRDALSSREQRPPQHRHAVKAAWHPGHWTLRRQSHLMPGGDVTHVTTPILNASTGTLVSDREDIARVLNSAAKMPHL